MLDTKAEWISRVLGIAIEPAGAGPSLVKLQQARLAWDGARKKAQSELSALSRDLRATVLAHNADDEAPDEYEPSDLEAGIERLEAMLGNLDETLLDALDDALNADAADRPAFVNKARAALGRFRAILAANKLLAAIDDNAFRPCTIRRDLDSALKAVAAAL